MSDEFTPVRCGCGGEAEVFHIAPEGYAGSYCVRCVKCLTQSPFFTGNKEKAIEVWNRAMGERTAKVTSLVLTSNPPQHVLLCGNCGGSIDKTHWKYCPNCGVRLEWNEHEID